MTREKEIYKVTLAGGVANLLLMAFKFVAGIVGRSSAMMADAIHSLSDFVTDLVVLIFVNISSRPQDESHDYGHGKYETLATLFIGLALAGVAIGIIVNGAVKFASWLQGEALPSPGKLALWAALVSIAVKELIYLYTKAKGRRLNSPALVANAWHHRSDALSSIGSLIGIAGARMGFPVMDPLAGILISLFILKAAADIFKETIDKMSK